MDFMIGSLAGMGAAFLTNPFDVVRTRMQLQGELKRGGRQDLLYKNVPHAIVTIIERDGVLALQKGISSSLLFQMIGSGVKLGLYQQVDHAGLLRDKNNITKFWNSMLAAGVTGAVGATIGSPLLLVKTQMQSASMTPVGTQHQHQGTVSALKRIYKTGGFRGLWRGTSGQMLRNSVGSSTQIASYSVTKDLMDADPWFKNRNKYTSAFLASNVGAIAKTVAMNPFDVIVTRLYNQPIDHTNQGKLYNGVGDCARKIFRTEGPLGFYKGIVPSYIRQAPQSVLLLMFWDVLKSLQGRIVRKIDRGAIR